MSDETYNAYLTSLAADGYDTSITYTPDEATFGWVDNPVAVAAVIKNLPIKDFKDTAAYGFSDEELPDHVYLWESAKQVTGDNLPPRNQGQVGSCFPAGAKIRMADGSYKNIENIKLRDKVLTAEGNIGKVTTCFLREEKSPYCLSDVMATMDLKLPLNIQF